MDRAELLAEAEAFVKERQEREGTGHDWLHTDRVRRMALRIAETEGADPLVVELGALFHDVADHKFHGGDSRIGANVTRAFLVSQGADADLIDRVCHIVEHVSFKGAGEPNRIASLEGRVVQDADRLDAIGAIGIARCFAYGGFQNRPIYDPRGITVNAATAEQNANRIASSSIHHFYEKLLLLKDRMNTATGRAFAESRHRFLETYLKTFFDEWDARQ